MKEIKPDPSKPRMWHGPPPGSSLNLATNAAKLHKAHMEGPVKFRQIWNELFHPAPKPNES